MRYRVCMSMMVSAVVDVEADSVTDAIQSVYDSPDMPGPITIDAFGGASVDEASEWEPTEVYAEGVNEPVWTERGPA